jgi:hypothetical protein
MTYAVSGQKIIRLLGDPHLEVRKSAFNAMIPLLHGKLWYLIAAQR